MEIQGKAIFGVTDMKIYFAITTKDHWRVLDRCNASNRLMSFWFLGAIGRSLKQVFTKFRDSTEGDDGSKED